jgi:hypothetical protein
MAFASDFDAFGPTPKPCPTCLRRDALGTLKRALREQALDGRSAAALSSAVMELERDPELDARAVLALFRTRQLA